jgi:hypothetical protein
MPWIVNKIIRRVQKNQGEYHVFMENTWHRQKHKVRNCQRKKTWDKIGKCTNFGAIPSFTSCFFLTCALFDNRKR